jgi:hypothetical protein
VVEKIRMTQQQRFFTNSSLSHQWQMEIGKWKMANLGATFKNLHRQCFVDPIWLSA